MRDSSAEAHEDRQNEEHDGECEVHRLRFDWQICRRDHEICGSCGGDGERNAPAREIDEEGDRQQGRDQPLVKEVEPDRVGHEEMLEPVEGDIER